MATAVDVERLDDVEVVEDAESAEVVVRWSKTAFANGAARQKSRQAAVAVIHSDSESSSSSGPSRSRSRERRSKQHVGGAAAATALLSSSKPVEVDQIVERTVRLPADFATRLQHEGGTVALMAELGTNITVSPDPDDRDGAVLTISGSAFGCQRAATELSLLHDGFREEERSAAEAAEKEQMAEIDVPAKYVNAVAGGSALVEVRSQCHFIMIAVQPPERPDCPARVCIGPGDRGDVATAKQLLLERLRDADKQARAADAVTEELEAVEAAVRKAAESQENPAAGEVAKEDEGKPVEATSLADAKDGKEGQAGSGESGTARTGLLSKVLGRWL